MDANRSKRRKSKDNPYTIFDEEGKLYVTFKDGKGIKHKIEVNNDIFNFFDDSELHDVRELNEFDRHIEHSEQSENTLHKKILSKDVHFEDIMISKMRNGQLKKMLFCLTPLQRERVIFVLLGKVFLPRNRRNARVYKTGSIIKHQESKKEIEKRNT